MLLTQYDDTPALVDGFGCEKYYDAIIAFIRSCPTPMTIAIQGEWGGRQDNRDQCGGKQAKGPF